ncbi:MAG: hypothetical protein IJQ82_06430 [Selenomonadaceae bacterium]|nr:hypothetical protein [Selenomonadaceae bacterium]
MIPKKFRAFDFDRGEYRTFYLSELLIGNPNFEFVDQDDTKQLCYRHHKTKEEFYEGDLVDFNRQGNPLSIEFALILIDNHGNSYQWDKRLLDNRDKIFPPWVNEGF